PLIALILEPCPAVPFQLVPVQLRYTSARTKLRIATDTRPTRNDLIYVEGVAITSSRENVAYEAFTSLPCGQDTGGESPCIHTQDGLKASDCGRLGRQASGHLGARSAW